MTGSINHSHLPQTLTDNLYWESYWKDEYKSIQTSVGELTEVFDQVPWDNYGNIIEIGGFPGTNVAYIAKNYGALPFLLDFVTDENTISKVAQAFELKQKITTIHQDFLKSDPPRLWDVVLSVGFIEHFSDPAVIIDRHFNYCVPGGVVIITVPNIKNSFYGIVTRLFNRAALKTHNTSCMSPAFFKKYAESRGIKKFETGYWGHSGNYWLPAEKENGFVKWPLLILKKMIRTVWQKSKGQFISPAIFFIAFKD